MLSICLSLQILLSVSKFPLSWHAWWFFPPCERQFWWMTLEDNRAPYLYFIKHCASFKSHGWIQTGITVQKRSIRVKIGDLLSRVTLKFDGWPWKQQGTFLCCFKLCELFHSRQWIQTGVTVQKRPTGVKIDVFCPVCNRAPLLSYFKLCASTAKLLLFTSVTLTFDLLPWPFARTSLLSLVITLEHFRLLR